MNLACQEHIIPGETVLDKWRTIQSLGFQGIELRGSGDDAFKARLPELREAVRQGARFPSICGILTVFVGDFDPEKRREAIARLKVLLSAAAELGAAGVISPAAYGIHSNRLPPHKARRPPSEDEQVLLDGFGELAEHAGREGVMILIEPLNRYEDHMINRLDQGVALCERIGSPAVAIMADLFHMNIEEQSLPSALIAARHRLAHLHAADSNRLEPGRGHIDFRAVRKALDEIDYTGFVALECGLSGEPKAALRSAAAALLKQ
jgi:sugar phosphate isomerase/epimerase